MLWLRNSAFKRQTFNHEAKIRVRYSDQLRSCLWRDEWIRIPVPHVAWKHLASCTCMYNSSKTEACSMDLRLQFPNEMSLVRYSHIKWEGLYFSGYKIVWGTNFVIVPFSAVEGPSFWNWLDDRLSWTGLPCSFLVPGGLCSDSTLRYVTTTSKLFAMHLAQSFFYSTFITDSTEIGLFRRRVVKLSRWNRKQNQPYKNY